jgi:hypothetical protein
MLSEQERQQIRKLGEIEDPLKLFDVVHAAKEKLLAQIRSQKRNAIKSSLLRNAMRTDAGSGNAKIEELEITGARLAALSSLNSGEQHVRELEADPFNTHARLGLVEKFLQNSGDDHLLLNRDAYLLALMEVELNNPSTHILRIATLAQKRYLEKLENFLLSEKTVEEGSSSNLDQIKEANRRMRYVSEVSKVLKYRTFTEDTEFGVNEILQSGRVRREDVGVKIAPLIESVANLPAAVGTRKRINDVLGRIASKHALASCLQGVMLRRDARMLVLQYIAGRQERGPEILAMMDEAKDKMQHSIKIMKMGSSKPEQAMCIREFTILCHSISQYFPMTANTIRPEHVELMELAVKLSGMLPQDRLLGDIQKKLISSIKTFRSYETKEEEAPAPEEKKSAKLDAQTKFFAREIPKEKALGTNEDVGKPKSGFFERPVPDDQF